jgi:hypothetical protein
MKLLIDIDLANDAFDGQRWGSDRELSRILRKLADKLAGAEIPEVPELLAALYDRNGNCVGACETRSAQHGN